MQWNGLDTRRPHLARRFVRIARSEHGRHFDQSEHLAPQNLLRGGSAAAASFDCTPYCRGIRDASLHGTRARAVSDTQTSHRRVLKCVLLSHAVGNVARLSFSMHPETAISSVSIFSMQ